MSKNQSILFSVEHLTPVAGLIFEAKIERYLLESFFLESDAGNRTDF